MKFLLTFLAIMTVACNNSPKENNAATEKPKTAEDSLYREVISYHDETMPKMGKLIGYQKALQTKIDSLTLEIKAKKNAEARVLKEKYQGLQADLKAAEIQMNNWMDSFEPDPKLPSQQELEQYWKGQQQKAKKMRDDILAAIDSSRSVIGQ